MYFHLSCSKNAQRCTDLPFREVCWATVCCQVLGEVLQFLSSSLHHGRPTLCSVKWHLQVWKGQDFLLQTLVETYSVEQPSVGQRQHSTSPAGWSHYWHWLSHPWATASQHPTALQTNLDDPKLGWWHCWLSLKGRQTPESWSCVHYLQGICADSASGIKGAGAWLPFPLESGYHWLSVDHMYLKKLCPPLKFSFLYCLILFHQHCSLFCGDFWHINMGEHCICVQKLLNVAEALCWERIVNYT